MAKKKLSSVKKKDDNPLLSDTFAKTVRKARNKQGRESRFVKKVKNKLKL